MDTALQITSLVLSLTALMVTGAGFFASLMFYREGKDLNTKAQDALARIDEKATMINEQIGKRFEMTLSSVLSGPASDSDGVRIPAITSDKESKPTEVPSDSNQSSTSDEETLDKSVLRYYNLRGMRLSDISNQDTRSMFEMGGTNGFKLFDGKGKIVFFGQFKQLKEEDILLNLRGLLNNVDIAYKSINDHASGEIVSQAIDTMEKIEVEILADDNLDLDHVEDKCEEFRSELRSVPVRIITKSQFEEELGQLKENAVG